MIDLQTIQRIALYDVEKGGWEYTYRKICRWYSQTFSTPLHIVEMDLLQEDVLQHYFENQIEKMKGAAEELDAKNEVIEAWEKFRSAIINGYEKARIQEETVKEEDDNWALEMQKILEEEEKQKQNQKHASKEANPNLFHEDVLYGQEVQFDAPPDYE